MDYSKITLGELLSSRDQSIRRNAIGILKQLERNDIDPLDLGYYCKGCQIYHPENRHPKHT